MIRCDPRSGDARLGNGADRRRQHRCAGRQAVFCPAEQLQGSGRQHPEFAQFAVPVRSPAACCRMPSPWADRASGIRLQRAPRRTKVGLGLRRQRLQRRRRHRARHYQPCSPGRGGGQAASSRARCRWPPMPATAMQPITLQQPRAAGCRCLGAPSKAPVSATVCRPCHSGRSPTLGLALRGGPVMYFTSGSARRQCGAADIRALQRGSCAARSGRGTGGRTLQASGHEKGGRLLCRPIISDAGVLQLRLRAAKPRPSRPTPSRAGMRVRALPPRSCRRSRSS